MSSAASLIAPTSAVSVIVPTFNRAKYLGECLDSLLAQTVPALEVLVIDDGSEDSTPALAATYGSRIRYFRKCNAGKPKAVSLGLEQARGDLIWLFDDDDVALPDAIEHRLNALHGQTGASWVYSAHCLGTDGPDGRILKGKPYTPPSPPPEAFFLEVMTSCFFHLNSALVKRSLFDAAGALDPELLTGEDYDMQIRLSRLGVPAFSPLPSFVFRQHQGTRGSKALQYSAAQRRGVFRRFSSAVGRKIRRDVPLSEYLTPPRHTDLPPEEVRAALLNRLKVMANHGCLQEFFEDLVGILDTSSQSRPITKEQAMQMSGAICAGFAYEAIDDDWDLFLSQARRLLTMPSGAMAVRSLAKGLLRLAKSYPGSPSERSIKAIRAIKVLRLSWS